MAVGPHNSIVGCSVLEDDGVLIGYRKAVILRCFGLSEAEGRREGIEITLFPQWTYLRHLQENGLFCLE